MPTIVKQLFKYGDIMRSFSKLLNHSIVHPVFVWNIIINQCIVVVNNVHAQLVCTSLLKVHQFF